MCGGPENQCSLGDGHAYLDPESVTSGVDPFSICVDTGGTGICLNFVRQPRVLSLIAGRERHERPEVVVSGCGFDGFRICAVRDGGGLPLQQSR